MKDKLWLSSNLIPYYQCFTLWFWNNKKSLLFSKSNAIISISNKFNLHKCNNLISSLLLYCKSTLVNGLCFNRLEGIRMAVGWISRPYDTRRALNSEWNYRQRTYWISRKAGSWSKAMIRYTRTNLLSLELVFSLENRDVSQVYHT